MATMATLTAGTAKEAFPAVVASGTMFLAAYITELRKHGVASLIPRCCFKTGNTCSPV